MSRPCNSPCSSTNSQQSPEPEQSQECLSDSEQEVIARKKRLHLSEDAQKICLNIYHNLRTVGNLGKTEALKKASALTGVSSSKIYNLTNNGVTKRKQRLDAGKPRKLTPSLANLIKKEIYDGYCKNEIPTVRALYQKLMHLEPGITLSEKTLRIWLKKAGFKFQLINKTTAVIKTTDPCHRVLVSNKKRTSFMFGYVDHWINSNKQSPIQSVTNISENRDSEEDADIYSCSSSYFKSFIEMKVTSKSFLKVD